MPPTSQDPCEEHTAKHLAQPLAGHPQMRPIHHDSHTQPEPSFGAQGQLGLSPQHIFPSPLTRAGHLHKYVGATTPVLIPGAKKQIPLG